MQLARFFRNPFVRRTPLDPANLGPGVRDLALRVMEDADVPFCLDLYRANEAEHFPGGYFDQYEGQLCAGDFLNLVAVREREPVGCVGLMSDANGDVWLCFAMVAPSHQRNGVGTALLLTSLALLTPVNGWSTMRLTAVPGSVRFYRRFGFLFAPAMADHKGVVHSTACLDLRAAEIDACRAVLAERRISYPDVREQIPRQMPPD